MAFKLIALTTAVALAAPALALPLLPDDIEPFGPHFRVDTDTGVGHRTPGERARRQSDPAYCNNDLIDSNGSLVIPSDWTTVPYRAFYDCASLVSVSFTGSSVETVGYAAFKYCSSLESVSFTGSSVETVHDYAFSSCTSLVSVNFTGSSVETVGEKAFEYCSSLKSVSFTGSSVETVHDYAFYSCTSLVSVNFTGSSVETLGEGAFYSCSSLESVFFTGSSVERVGNWAFYSCRSLESVIYDISPDQDSAISIAEDAFSQHGCGSTIDATSFAPPGVCKCAPFTAANRSAPCRFDFGVNPSSGGPQQARMQSHVDANVGSVFATGHTELVPGFDLNSNTLALADLFQNVRPGQDRAPLIAFSVVSNYAAGDPRFGTRSAVSLGDNLFVSSSTGTMSLKMDNPGNHTVRLIARTGTGPAELTQPVELLSLFVCVQEPGTFGLRQDSMWYW